MSFKQIVINIDSKSADELSDIFFDLNALSVSIEDQYEGTELEQPIFDEPGIVVDRLWDFSKIVVLYDENVNIPNLISEAVKLLGHEFSYAVEHVDDEDWVRKTQSQFKPIKINDNFYIVPSWHDLPDKTAKSIILDPGLAFGTGSHPTTFMCLEWLAQNVLPQHSVLDYGCGSGILAISAKIHGAHTVHGVDIDPQAIESSIINAQNNSAHIKFTTPDKKLTQKSYDIVVANILSNPLRILAPTLAKLTQSKLILSGILHSQSEELMDIYSQWFKVTEARILDGWVLLECSK